MRASAFLPNDILRPYIKCHWVYAAGDKDLTAVLYPSGHLELAINISSGSLTTIIKDHAIKMPRVEILGQLTSYGTLMITKATTLLITRFYPQASALFFPNPASEFTDDSVDLNEIFNQEADQVYYRIMEQDSIVEKINVLECFLIGKLAENEKKLRKLKIVESICGQLMQSCSVPSIIGGFESRYGFSERYIQKTRA